MNRFKVLLSNSTRDELLSNFAFNFNVRHYHRGRREELPR